MQPTFTDSELAAFLDEALPVERMAAIEQALRDDSALSDRLVRILGQRDAGCHTLGSIWRRNRLSCPTREQLGSYLMQILEPGYAKYVQFHLETVGCRICNANLEDLRQQSAAEAVTDSELRRRKYFHSSAGYLHGKSQE